MLIIKKKNQQYCYMQKKKEVYTQEIKKTGKLLPYYCKTIPAIQWTV